MKRRPFKYAIIVLALLMLTASCLQFRYTDRRQLKDLSHLQNRHLIKVDKLSISGREIHYTWVQVSSDYPTAIFIHGSPGSSSNFIQFAKDDQLLEAYNVLLIDRPGFGYSEFGVSEPSILKQASLINELLDSLRITERILIGHSLGGPIVCKMAMDAPDNTQGLLLVAGSVSPELEPNEPWRKPLSSKPLRWLLPKSFRVSNDEILAAKSELIKMEDDWHKIVCQVTIIQGDKDKLVPPGNAEYARQKLQNAKQVKVMLLENENHFIPFTKPELLTNELLAF